MQEGKRQQNHAMWALESALYNRRKIEPSVGIK